MIRFVKAVVSFLVVLFVAFPLFPQSPAISHDPRELGLIMLTELGIRDGKLLFRTASNGCTDQSSFKARVRREADTVSGVPAYRRADRAGPDEGPGTFRNVHACHGQSHDRQAHID